jgi:hypothetical protein
MRSSLFEPLISQSSGRDKPLSIDATKALNEHGLGRKGQAILYEAAANKRAEQGKATQFPL